MSDKIKVHLSGKRWQDARDKGADYFILDGKECIFYDKKGKELWREKEGLAESFRSESSE